MHEYSIAYDIFATAKKAALENGADKVTKIHVEIGELAMASKDQIEFLFSAISSDDPLFHEITIECFEGKIESRCKCGYEGNERFICPICGALPEIIRGREILVKNIEIEVKDE